MCDDPIEVERGLPLISVIVCTRNRPTHIPRAVASILQSDYPNFALLIVDQSDNVATARAIAPFLGSRVKLLQLAGKGKAAALNHARDHVHGEYLALTDDDCEMAPDCLSSVAAAFQADPSLGIIFGEVVAGPHDCAREHIPHSDMLEPCTIRDPADYLRIPVRRGAHWLNHGMGANMALRAATLHGIWGWDCCLGPGGKFGSGDDHDLAFRALRAGYGVRFCPDARVVHYGVQRVDKLPQYYRRIGRGFGASFVKYLKCGAPYPGAARTFRFHLLKCGLRAVSLRRGHDSGPFVVGWVSGFLAGLFNPVDKQRLRFEHDGSAQSAAPAGKAQITP